MNQGGLLDDSALESGINNNVIAGSVLAAVVGTSITALYAHGSHY